MFRTRNLMLTVGLAILALAAALAIRSYSFVAPTLGWTRVEGRVLDSGSETIRVTSRFGDGWAEEPRIRYAFEVDGRTLTGNRIYPGYSWHYDKDEMLRDFLRPYAPGAAVTVFYDPADPSRAVLLREGDYMWSWILLGVGLWFTLIGWAIRAHPDSRAKIEESGSASEQ